MAAADRITRFQSDSGGEGPCPVCHKPRTTYRCRTWWEVELKRGKWTGTLYVTCASFANEREELSEALNKYHVRPATPEVQDGK